MVNAEDGGLEGATLVIRHTFKIQFKIFDSPSHTGQSHSYNMCPLSLFPSRSFQDTLVGPALMVPMGEYQVERCH